MAVSPAIAYQHALCMDLRQDRLAAAIVHKTSRKIADRIELTGFDFNREGLDKLLKDSFFVGDYGDFVLTAGTVRNTLVPTSIFNGSKPGEIFNLNYTKPFDNLDYNRLPELDIVNIYELPIWVKSAFVIRFPRVKILHRTSVLLKGIFDQTSFYLKTHLFIEENSFYLFMTEKNKLIFFNRFDYKTVQDIVYHVLFVAEQKMIPQEKLDVQFYGINESWQGRKEFETFFKSGGTLSTEPEKGEFFMLAKQILCV